MENVYDVIIIGSGPAGLTAAIYAKRREMKTVVVGKELGGQLMWASEIENYPGFKSIKSFELISRMHEQALSCGVELKNSNVQELQGQDGYFVVKTEQEILLGKTIILAIGLSPRNLDIPGEKEFTGRGVSYCANCDGPFFKNKNVAVIGGGNAALDAAEVMSKIASQVYVIQNSPSFNAFETLVSKVKESKNVSLFMNSATTKIIGKNKVEGVEIKNILNGEIQEIKVDGVFIEIGRTAKTELVKELVKIDEKNQVIVDEKCATSTPGVYAAGDVTQIPYKQIVTACGQGAIAALSAYQYLQLKVNN